LIEFLLHQQNIRLFNFRIVIFCCTPLHTLGKLEVILIFKHYLAVLMILKVLGICLLLPTLLLMVLESASLFLISII
jgi:hypothetical protein